MERTQKQKKPVLSGEERARARSRRNKRIRQFLPFYIMMLPGLLYLLINNYLPMGGLVIAFKKVNYALGIFNSPWAGLSNFKFLFSNNDALNALRNTVLYNVGFIVFGNLLAITVAIALDCVKNKFLKRFSQENICQGGFHPKDEIPLISWKLKDNAVSDLCASLFVFAVSNQTDAASRFPAVLCWFVFSGFSSPHVASAMPAVIWFQRPKSVIVFWRCAVCALDYSQFASPQFQ